MVAIIGKSEWEGLVIKNHYLRKDKNVLIKMYYLNS